MSEQIRRFAILPASLVGPSRPRFEGEGGGAATGQSVQAIDLTHPSVVQAIAAARQAAVTEFDTEKAKILANRDEILTEKKAWDVFGMKPADVAARLKKAEEMETAAMAAGLGADPKAFSEAVEKAAQAKYETRAAELSQLQQNDKTRIGELEKQVETLTKDNHRSFVAKELALASMPEDMKIVHDGAYDYLIDQLASTVVPHKVDGMPAAVARLKVNGALVPGKAPDGLMSLNELLAVTRTGKGPMPHLGFCLVSAGQGSDTKSVKGGEGAAGGNWWKMNDQQRDDFVNTNGSAAARELMDNSPRA